MVLNSSWRDELIILCSKCFKASKLFFILDGFIYSKLLCAFSSYCLRHSTTTCWDGGSITSSTRRLYCFKKPTFRRSFDPRVCNKPVQDGRDRRLPANHSGTQPRCWAFSTAGSPLRLVNPSMHGMAWHVLFLDNTFLWSLAALLVMMIIRFVKVFEWQISTSIIKARVKEMVCNAIMHAVVCSTIKEYLNPFLFVLSLNIMNRESLFFIFVIVRYLQHWPWILLNTFISLSLTIQLTQLYFQPVGFKT